jgi:DNA-binding GntR family transcriptional regulator
MIRKTLATSIREGIRSRILEGVWEGRIPSEPDLVKLFDASRETVRKALGMLEAEGLIYRMHGKGTFIEEPVSFNPLSGFLSITEELARAHHPVSSRVLESGWIPPSRIESPFLRGFFEDAPRVWFLRRLRLVKDEVLALELSYFRESDFPDIAGQDLGGSLHALMTSRYDLSPDRVRNRYSALDFRLKAAREAARLLGSRQALRVERTLVQRREVYYAVSFTLRTDLYPLELLQLPGRTGEGML